MGKVILKTKRGQLISLKCKSEKRAAEIAGKRPNVISFNYYNEGAIIPRARKKQVQRQPQTFEEIEMLCRQQGLI